MPDLGKYAEAVLSAYGISLALLLLLVAFTIWRSRRVKQALRDYEARKTDG